MPASPHRTSSLQRPAGRSDADEAASSVDGRRVGRERRRRAVIDATIDLVLSTGRVPSTEQVAERAGVSTASVFRYFDHLDDLRRETIRRYFERFDDLIDLPAVDRPADHDRIPPVSERVADLIEARQVFYETTEPMARLARSRAVDIADIDSALDHLNARMTARIDELFGPELSCLDTRDRIERVAVLAALTSFEGWDRLRRSGLDRDGIGRALRRAVRQVVAGGADPSLR